MKKVVLTVTVNLVRPESVVHSLVRLSPDMRVAIEHARNNLVFRMFNFTLFDWPLTAFH